MSSSGLEMLLKGSPGMLARPPLTTTAAILGWPRPGERPSGRACAAPFSPGIAIASALNAKAASPRGLALGGSVAINLAAAAFLLTTAILQPSATPPPGGSLTWLMAAGLFLLSLIEIALAA